MISNVNTTSTTLWPSVSRQSNNRQQSPNAPQGFGRISPELSSTVPGLSIEN